MTIQYQDLLGTKWLSLLVPNNFQYNDKGLVLCFAKVPPCHKSATYGYIPREDVLYDKCHQI